MGRTLSHRDWNLSADAFDKLLATLDADREQAALRYEDVRRRLVKFFEWRGLPLPEEHVDEVLDRAARRVTEGESIGDLHSYIGGIARLLLMEIRRHQQQEREALDTLATILEAAEQNAPAQEKTFCFKECLARLPEEARALILDYYGEERDSKVDTRQRLAERLRVPLSTLRTRVHRIRGKLKQCFNACRSN